MPLPGGYTGIKRLPDSYDTIRSVYERAYPRRPRSSLASSQPGSHHRACKVSFLVTSPSWNLDCLCAWAVHDDCLIYPAVRHGFEYTVPTAQPSLSKQRCHRETHPSSIFPGTCRSGSSGPPVRTDPIPRFADHRASSAGRDGSRRKEARDRP